MALRADQSSALDLSEPWADDKELTLAFQQGQKGAYQDIYDRHADRVHGVCRRMLPNPEDAKEAAQESFLRVYSALGRFNGRYQLRAWITRIATNVCVDMIRNNSRRPMDVVELDELREIRLDQHPSSDPEEMVIRNAEGRQVRRTLNALPPLQRAAIVLRDFEGLSYEDVAISLDISECQAKALIYRARQNFKRSWSVRVLSALFPYRWMERAKQLEGRVEDQGGRVATTLNQAQAVVASPSAITCSTIIQSCTQVVSERGAAVMTAMLVGSAAVSGAALTKGNDPAPANDNVQISTDSAGFGSSDAGEAWRFPWEPAPPEIDRQVARVDPDDQPLEPGEVGPIAPEPAPPIAPDPPPEPAPETPNPEPEPTVEPEPEPPAEEPGDPGGHPGDEEPKPDDDGDASTGTEPPPPEPFRAAVGFEFGTALDEVIPNSHQETVDCAAGTLTQEMDIPVIYDGGSYDAHLKLQFDSHITYENSLRFELMLPKDGYKVFYFGKGMLLRRYTDENSVSITYSGQFSSPYAESVNLPQKGSFRADFQLDCSSPALAKERLALRAE